MSPASTPHSLSPRRGIHREVKQPTVEIPKEFHREVKQPTVEIPKGFLFDMDGTLVDSLSDIGNAMNVVLASYGFPQHAIETYKTLVGEGARSLVEKSLPKDAQHRAGEALTRYKARYATHLVVESKPYEGIVELLTELSARGDKLGVVTNKPHDAAVGVMTKLFPEIHFAIVVGQKDGTPHKPDPSGALLAAQALGTAPSETFFVGDTDTDMKTATNAGMIAVGVLWGFRDEAELKSHGAHHIVLHPRDLLALR